ncbi:MAG: hypothetical protein KY454_14000 [Actinobacteria bacterium]|nr:hypothetical protein [Actinomycetota bacterium]MBW3614554.1 hypothetical protein [Actinomycetota bacterium]
MVVTTASEPGLAAARRGRKATAEGTAAYAVGRSAPYGEWLLFDVPPGGTEDLDESMMAGAAVKQAAGKVKDALTGDDDETTERRTGAGAETP